MTDEERREDAARDDVVHSRAELEEDDAYEPDDPKHAGFHASRADLWDNREKCP